jgi:L-alanine-DL-glutamate epimerase-like enolase superfamily enzyme
VIPTLARDRTAIDRIEARAYTIPTEQPESDGTLQWDSTTLVVVLATSGDTSGLGYTYAHVAATDIISDELAGVVCGMDAMWPSMAWARMWHDVRNYGQTGVVSAGISAVDVALWDLKARLLGIPLVAAIDAVHDAIPIYGSGGFTSYDLDKLGRQLAGWAEDGIPRVKIKVGRDPEADHDRLKASRKAIGEDVELYVDANGAFTRKQGLHWADVYAAHDVRWYEEPVSSDDLEGLRLLRDRSPASMDIAAGEYGWNLPYFQQMLDAGAVDCLQADVTRCGGISGFVRVASLCDARSLDLSGHCAPQVSAQVCTAAWHLRHLEYFHDHVRIEHMAFDGCLAPESGGVLRPDRTRPGLGLELKETDMEPFRVR